MEEKILRKQIRRSFNSVSWSLVIYYVIMNVAVTAVVFVDVVIREIQAIASGGTGDMELPALIALSSLAR